MKSTAADLIHVIADGFVFNTEGRGHATPGGLPLDGQLTNVDGTQIRFVRPHSFAAAVVLEAAGALPDTSQAAACCRVLIGIRGPSARESQNTTEAGLQSPPNGHEEEKWRYRSGHSRRRGPDARTILNA